MTRLLIIIVNYRTGALVIDALRSLAPAAGRMPGLRVVVTDNASGDGSVDRIAEAIRSAGWEWAGVLPLDHNGGFSAGNNAAIRAATASTDPPDYFMLLNPDTRVHDGAVDGLAAYMDVHPAVGIAGSALESPDGQVQLAHHRFPHPLGELLRGARLGMLDRLLPAHLDPPPQAAAPLACDWVSGASMIIRRQVFQDIGLLDEGYFLYFEEVDFCFRAKRAGWEIHHVPETRVMHLEGESTGIQQTRRRRKPYWYESRRRFFLKSYGLRGLVAGDLLWLAGRSSLGLRRLLRLGGGTRNDPRWFALDLLVGDLAAVLSGRLPARTVEGKP